MIAFCSQQTLSEKKMEKKTEMLESPDILQSQSSSEDPQAWTRMNNPVEKKRTREMDVFFLPLLHGGQGLVLLELLAPHNDLHTLLAESTHGHVCDSLCDLGTLVGMEGIGILVSLRSLLLVAPAARRLFGLVNFRHDGGNTTSGITGEWVRELLRDGGGPGLLNGRFLAEVKKEDGAQEQRYNEELRTESECRLFFFSFFSFVVEKSIRSHLHFFWWRSSWWIKQRLSSFDDFSKNACGSQVSRGVFNIHRIDAFRDRGK